MQCALSDRWKYQRHSRCWSRLDSVDLLPDQSPQPPLNQSSTGVHHQLTPAWPLEGRQLASLLGVFSVAMQ